MQPWMVDPSLAGGIMLVSGLVSSLFALFVWRRPDATAARALAGVLLTAGAWSLAYGMELTSTGPAVALWGDAKYIGICLLPPAWLVFALRYTAQDRRLTPRLLLALFAEPVAILFLLALPATHDLIRYYRPAPNGLPDAQVGPLFWVHFTYVYVLLAVGTGALVLSLVRASRIYRKPSLALLATLAVPWAANALYNFDVEPVASLDLTPIAFSFAAIVLVWGVFRVRLLDVMPIARSKIVETMRDAVLVLDPFERVVDLNPAAQRILRLSAADAIGRPAAQVLPPQGTAELHQPTDGREIALHDGTDNRHYELSVSRLGDHTGPRAPTLLVLRDITERKLAEERLDHLAHYDPMTGLPNRKLFGDRLAQGLAQARRTDERLALLFCDLDRFKVVNDTLGHEAGDALLRQVAERLRATVREQDTTARLGGDEFTLLAPGGDSPEAAAHVAAAVLAALREPFRVADQELHVTASIGIALWPDDADSAQELLRRADAAMYRAKRHGGNRFEFHMPETTWRVAERLHLERDLRRALNRDELRVLYQPYVSLRDGTVEGCEALVRWAHPTRGVLAPEAFLPLAEDTGLITGIDRWVLHSACNWAAQHSRARNPAVVGVNLSAAALADEDLADTVAAALHAARLEPEQLLLEFSEHLGAGYFGGEQQLGRLKELGVRLALDDFGSGTTSLGHLKDLPLDRLKIDRRFLDGLLRAAGDPLILSAMVNFAHTMGLPVTAEGIESAGQLDRLRELQCDTGQGFWFSRPVSAARAGAMVRAGDLRGAGRSSR